MAAIIDEALELLLRDDNLHTIEEISKELGITRGIGKRIADFLIKYDFAQIKGHKLKVNPKLRAIASSREPYIDQSVLVAPKAKPT